MNNLYTLDQICKKITDGSHQSPKEDPTGYPMVSVKDMTEFGFDLSKAKHISKNDFEKLVKQGCKPEVDDILIAKDGSVMKHIFRVRNADNIVLLSSIAILRPNKEIVYPDFLVYSLKNNRVKEDILNNYVSGSGVPRIVLKDFKKVELDIPNLDLQINISKKLRSLDDKIELNTQINQTLEQIAQALFKSWFVDFDPVRAKAQALSDGLSLEQAELAAMQAISGKTPEELTALSQTQPDRYAELAETAKAFPCEMVEIDGVEVPKGWEVKPLPEIIDFLEGPGIRNWQYTDEEDGIKFINIRCIQNGDFTLTTANKITKEEAFGKYKHFQLEEDDIVVSTSGTLGRFAFVRKEHLPLSLNTSVIRFRPIKNKSTLGFIAGFVENQLQHELEIRASGSAQRNFGPTHLKQISLLVPDFKLLELHQKYVSSLFEKRKQLLSEIDVLKDTRDLLLPKLLNGEI